ncbi:MAG: SPOR domain-containing protein, partial [Sphingomonadales bacterium]|nr:SPOR domain-containing protein [Sphingomonadales bacterium]
PQVVLKMALVSVAQGKNGQAIAFLDAAKDAIDPADYGLALALAGQPQQAAQLLQQAAQQVGADSRVRQNLALALAFSGDWTGARTVAAQDVPGDQLDARIQQWMQIAKPARASDQVASLTGITPAAADPGQPVRLALKDAGTRLAAAAPVTEAAPVEVAEVAPAPVEVPAAAVVAAVQAPVASPVAVAASAPVAIASLMPKPSPRASAPRPSLSPRAAALTDTRALYRHAALTTQGRSRAVVQLGAYASRATVTAAWSRVSARFGALRGYAPVAARFNGERGTVYRLSVNGFASARQAIDLCGSLKRAGGACFVRNVAGDAPVQVASRS